jgi:hypothetical protein
MAGNAIFTPEIRKGAKIEVNTAMVKADRCVLFM